jgi:sn-glycerol 3-phosphate transport system substrate-binding protein
MQTMICRGLIALMSLWVCAPALAATDIQFWHAMKGPLAEEVDALVRQFNESQKEFRVIATYKGNYDETLSAGLAAHRAGRAPHVVQVFEVGTANMMAAKNSVRPAWQVMAEAGERFEARSFIPAIGNYYADSSGRLMAMPFNTSTPVLYYNKDAFRRAKLDPERAPKTWYEMIPILGALRDVAEMPCSYATSWPSWILLENTSVSHAQEFATKGNGVGGTDAKLVFNTHLMMRHISTMMSWLKSGYFTYTGRQDEAEERFKRGECGVLTASSATYAELQRQAKFAFGVSNFPYYDDIKGAPQNTLIGGAALWVMQGHQSEAYRGVAKFFGFLSRPEVQATWHQKTGYIPVTIAAYELTRKQGFYLTHPGHEIALQQLMKNPNVEAKGIRLGAFAQIRAVIEEELEAAWAEKKTPKQALDAAADRGNEYLRRFHAANHDSSSRAEIETSGATKKRASTPSRGKGESTTARQ